MVMMYTGNIIGKANVLSCEQVDELIEIRKKLGITSGGIPPCAAEASNTADVVAQRGTVAERTMDASLAGGNAAISEAEVEAIVRAVLKRLR